MAQQPEHVDVRLEPPASHDGLTQTLEPLVAHVEQRLGALADSLRERDVQAIELQAQELHRALALAVQSFMHAARHGGVPEAMRLRLARASAQLARQREALSRATAALDRAIDVLMPGAAAPVGRIYNANGLSTPLRSSTNLNA
jgi:exonuclease VII large subunit